MNDAKNAMKCWGPGLAAATIALSAGVVAAEPDYMDAWSVRYGTSTLAVRMQSRTGSSCNVCHNPPSRSSQGNCYKNDIRAKLLQGMTINQALAAVELMDSDGDGVNNVTEITMVRADLPGQVGFNPGLIGPLGTSPCASNTGTAVTSQPETPPASCYANCDGSTISPILNVSDFICFQTKYAAGDTYANCDNSTIAPILNVSDFICFQTKFSAGCP